MTFKFCLHAVLRTDQRGHDLSPQCETLWVLSLRWGHVNTVYLMRHCAGDTLPCLCLAESLLQYSQIIGRLMSRSSEPGQRVPKTSEREGLVQRPVSKVLNHLVVGCSSDTPPCICHDYVWSQLLQFLILKAKVMSFLQFCWSIHLCFLLSDSIFFPLVQQLQSINNNIIFFLTGS